MLGCVEEVPKSCSFAHCKTDSPPSTSLPVSPSAVPIRPPAPASPPARTCDVQAGGSDIIELGIPFSDPLADGPTVQRASMVALENGISVAGCLELARAGRVRQLRHCSHHFPRFYRLRAAPRTACDALSPVSMFAAC